MRNSLFSSVIHRRICRFVAVTVFLQLNMGWVNLFAGVSRSTEPQKKMIKKADVVKTDRAAREDAPKSNDPDLPVLSSGVLDAADLAAIKQCCCLIKQRLGDPSSCKNGEFETAIEIMCRILDKVCQIHECIFEDCTCIESCDSNHCDENCPCFCWGCKTDGKVCVICRIEKKIDWIKIKLCEMDGDHDDILENQVSIFSKLCDLATKFDECCDTVQDKLDDLGDDIEECCDTIQDKLDDLSDDLNDCCFTINSKID